METLLRKYIWAVDLVVIALCAIFLARATATAVETNLITAGPPVKAAVRIAAPAAGPVYTKQVEDILKRNVFCSTCPPILAEAEGPRPGPTPPPPLQRTSLPLKLLAIMFAPPPADPRWSVAVMRDTEPRARARTPSARRSARPPSTTSTRPRVPGLQRAARVPGPARPAAAPAAAGARRAAAAAPTDPLSAELDKGIKKIGEHNYEVQRATVDSLLGNMGALAKRGPHRARDPRRQGGRVPPVQRPARRAVREDRPAERRRHLGDQRPGDDQPRQGAARSTRSSRRRTTCRSPSNATDRKSPRTTTSDEKDEPETAVAAAWLQFCWARARCARRSSPAPTGSRSGSSRGDIGAAAVRRRRRPRRRARRARSPACRTDRSGSAGRRRATPGTPTPAATPPGATPAARRRPAVRRASPASNQLIGDKEFNSCKKFPAGKRIVKLNLKPDTELGDLIAWISSITCKQFLLPGTIPANSKKVTVVAPELITPEEAYRLFLGALESVGPDRRARGQVPAHRRDRPSQDDGRHPGLRRGRRRPDAASATSPA